jgi:hypothetical protein
MTTPKILFVLKKRRLYNMPTAKTLHSGLFNSATFVNEMLNRNGIESNLVQVDDNNCIDREVSKYKPTHVIIEALWVIPEKFDTLHKLHPKVNWIIRLHSEMPFIANEGMAMEWIFIYDKMGKRNKIHIAPNTEKMYGDLKKAGVRNMIFLPNYYPVVGADKNIFKNKDHVDIGCFGAIRPMKNQLIQAVAAIDFGNKITKPVHFHINSERIEKGDSALRNIRALFENQEVHTLVEHPWYSHEDFNDVIRKMDIGLQVSLNETFNIVAADFVSNNIPIVGSNEINWLSCFYKANQTSSDDIVKKMKFAYRFRRFNFQKLNKLGLIMTGEVATKAWVKYFKKH